MPHSPDGPEDPAATVAALRLLYEGELSQFVAKRIAPSHDAEDITQQTMLRALRGLNGFRGDNLRAWLFSIARNLIADRHREIGRTDGVWADDVPEEELGGEPHPVQTICECRERMLHCLACFEQQVGLPEQVALMLADMHGWRDRDSAKRMQLPLPAFKWLLYRARSRIHQFAGGACPLVSKTGITAPCAAAPGQNVAGKRSLGEPRLPSPASHRFGLSDEDLHALRRSLVRDLVA